LKPSGQRHPIHQYKWR